LSPPSTESRQSKILSGVGFAIATALLFGFSTPLAKLLLNQQVEPWILAGLLFAGGGCCLLPIVFLRHRLAQHGLIQPVAYLQSEEWRWIWISTFAGGIVAPISLMFGLNMASASSVALLLNFEAVFTAILAWTVFREHWQWPVFLGIIPITFGGILLSQSSGEQAGWSWGSLAILLTCLAWAVDSNVTFRVSHRDPFQIALIKTGSAGLLNVAIALSMGQRLPAWPLLLKVGGVGFLCYGLTYCCFVLALRRIGPSRTSAFFALSPLLSTLLAVVVLHESITVTMVIAAAFMTGGALLCAWEPPNQAE
jgi:drug/metabolite transporter (DMT)-like permease